MHRFGSIYIPAVSGRTVPEPRSPDRPSDPRTGRSRADGFDVALEVRAEVARRIGAVGWSLRAEVARQGGESYLVIDGEELSTPGADGSPRPLMIPVDGRPAPVQAARVLQRIRLAGVLPTPGHPAVFDRNQSIWCAPV